MTRAKVFKNKEAALVAKNCFGVGDSLPVPLQGNPEPVNGKSDGWVLVRVTGWCNNPDGTISKCQPIPQFYMEDGEWGFPTDLERE